MAKAAFWQRGESLDYKNTGDTKIDANTILLYGSRLAVVGCDIAPGETGSMRLWRRWSQKAQSLRKHPQFMALPFRQH